MNSRGPEERPGALPPSLPAASCNTPTRHIQVKYKKLQIWKYFLPLCKRWSLEYLYSFYQWMSMSSPCLWGKCLWPYVLQDFSVNMKNTLVKMSISTINDGQVESDIIKLTDWSAQTLNCSLTKIGFSNNWTTCTLFHDLSRFSTTSRRQFPYKKTNTTIIESY